MESNNPPPLLPEKWSQDFQEFVDLCVEKDPQQRATADELLKVIILLLLSSYFSLFYLCLWFSMKRD